MKRRPRGITRDRVLEMFDTLPDLSSTALGAILNLNSAYVRATLYRNGRELACGPGKPPKVPAP